MQTKQALGALMIMSAITGVYLIDQEYIDLSDLDKWNPFKSNQYTLKIMSNTRWQMYGLLYTEDSIGPLSYIHTGNYTLTKMKNVESIQISILGRIPWSENDYIIVEIYRGKTLLYRQETEDWWGIVLEWYSH